jgi:hypothetical protein
MGKGSFSGAGGAGWLFRSEGHIALGCQGIVIDVVGRRLDKEKNTSLDRNRHLRSMYVDRD